MKTILLLLVMSFFLFSCKNNSESTEKSIIETSNRSHHLTGVWELVSFYNYKDNKVRDTIKVLQTNKQIKMYSSSKVMWSRLRASDSLDWFGYGNYVIEDGSLIEVLDYGSKAMNNIIKEKKEFVFDIIFEDNKFSQIQIDEEGNALYAENYKRIE